MSETWLSIVGVGDDGLAGLAPAARPLFEGAEILVGGARHLAMVPDDGREKIEWPSPLLAIVERLRGLRGQKVCVLASGDPQWFGIGSTLGRAFSSDEMRIVPGQSAFSLAAARLAWPIDDVCCMTLHGRPVELLRTALHPGAKILALAHDRTTPAIVADLLANSGFGHSTLTVLEHMGGPDEKIVADRAETWSYEGADFHTIAIECADQPTDGWWSQVPGLPDDAFIHDGKLTKREVRAATLSKLMPAPKALLWDVGVGCGSIAIEWMRASKNARAIGIDNNPDRIAMASENALALGAPGLKLVRGSSPDDLADLPAPDAVFIGGGLSDNVFEAVWEALQPGGRLVANAVTLEGEAVLLRLFEEHHGELTRIAVQRAAPVGSFHGWKSIMPVTQWSIVK